MNVFVFKPIYLVAANDSRRLINAFIDFNRINFLFVVQEVNNLLNSIFYLKKSSSLLANLRPRHHP
jgi:hypothetical protein